MEVTVDFNAPIFQPQAEAVIDAWLDEATRDVATQGYADVMTNLNRTLKDPTPYYETQVTVDAMQDGFRVHDRDVIYGPWLDGVGSRNKTARFKGYGNWRRAKQGLPAKVPALVERSWPKYLGRLT